VSATIQFAVTLFLMLVWSRMELRATNEINRSLSSARVSRINGNHIEAMSSAGKQRIVQRVHGQLGADMYLGRNRSQPRSGMGAQYAAHPLHKR